MLTRVVVFLTPPRAVKSALKNWYPFTIMVGGSQANFLVKAQENDFGKMMTGGTLPKSLGATLYKVSEPPCWIALAVASALVSARR